MDRTRLSFLSIVVLIVIILALVWYIYNARCSGNKTKKSSLADLWFIALTQYPRTFFLVSLLIPSILSFVGFAYAGYQIPMNLEFDSYLEIQTDLDTIKDHYNTAKDHNTDMYNNEICQSARFRELQGFPLITEEDEEQDMQQTLQRELQLTLLEEEHEKRHLAVSTEADSFTYSSTGPKIALTYQNRHGGNVFTPAVLQSMYDLEQRLLSFPGFGDACFGFSGGDCIPFDSLVKDFFPNGHLVSNIDAVLQSYLDNPQALWKMDQYFGPNQLSSNITKTFVWLKDTSYSNPRALDSFYRSLYQWLWKLDQDKFYPDLVVTWENEVLQDLEAQEALKHDTLWSIGSLCFIGLMILFKVQHLFVFFFGMVGLILSFSTAFYWSSLHFYDIQDITLLHVAGLFVMLGIGADDIFLMVDSYHHAKAELLSKADTTHEEKHAEDDGDDCDYTPSEEQRQTRIIQDSMKGAYSMAGSMMLVSSTTTAVCFFSNAFGVLEVIQEFGIFMGLVVMINFIHVMTILPSAILVHELYILSWSTKMWNNLFPKDASNHEDETDQDAEEGGPIQDEMSKEQHHEPKNDVLSRLNRMDHWLVNTYAPMVTKRRSWVVVFFLVLSCILGTCGVFYFHMSDGSIVLFTDRYNLGRLSTIDRAYYNNQLSITVEKQPPSTSTPTPSPPPTPSPTPTSTPQSVAPASSNATATPSSDNIFGGGISVGPIPIGDPIGNAEPSVSEGGSISGNGEAAGSSPVNVPIMSGSFEGDALSTPPPQGDGDESTCSPSCQNGGTCLGGRCYCQTGSGGSDCGINTGKQNLKRREAIEVSLIWGFDASENNLDELWLVTAASSSDEANQQSGLAAPRGAFPDFDIASPETQAWFLQVVELARNKDNGLAVRSDKSTWIEMLRDFAMNDGVGFPIPREQFADYVQKFKSDDCDFAELAKKEIGTASPNLAGDFVFASITFFADVVHSKDSLSMTSYNQWSSFTESLNGQSPLLPPAVAYSKVFEDAVRTQETVNSTVTSWVVANCLCLLVILFFTQNVLLSGMVMATLILIFLCLAGLLFAVFSLPFGPVEVLGVSIFIGLSGNYSLHVVHAFHRSISSVRDNKVKQAVFITGSPIVASALSTLGGAAFLFGCRTYAFVELGILMCCITVLALLFSMAFLLSWLAISGPLPYEKHNDHDTEEEQDEDHYGHEHRLHDWDIQALCRQCWKKPVSDDAVSQNSPNGTKCASLNDSDDGQESKTAPTRLSSDSDVDSVSLNGDDDEQASKASSQQSDLESLLDQFVSNAAATTTPTTTAAVSPSEGRPSDDPLESYLDQFVAEAAGTPKPCKDEKH